MVQSIQYRISHYIAEMVSRLWQQTMNFCVQGPGKWWVIQYLHMWWHHLKTSHLKVIMNMAINLSWVTLNHEKIKSFKYQTLTYAAVLVQKLVGTLDSKVDGANMRLICGQQDPGGPHVGPINLAIWDYACKYFTIRQCWAIRR